MNAIAIAYVLTAAAAALYASFEMRFLWHFVRRRAEILGTSDLLRRRAPIPDAAAPMLTIQIPLYNERTVAEIAIRAAAAQDYPRDRFEIQVLDDSTDETQAIVAAVVAELQAQGLHISHLRRARRTGYKAGALAYGLESARGELLAIFDADFAPAPDFARRLILDAGVFEDESVAFAQARWDFVNPRENLLTSAQSLMIERHFFVQKPTWQYLGRVTMFNGSGGIWRRAAIEDAGGWSSETLTEDLDLSYRAAIRGWRGLYVPSIASDSELPSHLLAFKLQQRRWARGCAQAIRRLAPAVLGARGLQSRADELFVLGGYAVHPILLLNTLLWPWAVVYTEPRELFLIGQLVVGLATLVGPISFAVSAREVGRPLSLAFARDVLFATLLGMGLMVNNTIAHIGGYLSRHAVFERTPKRARSREVAGYPLAVDATLAAELGLLAYCVASAAWLLQLGELMWVPPCILWTLSLCTMIALQLAPDARPLEKRTS